MLLDSNIIIYSFQNKYKYLQDFIKHQTVYCSAISRIETLGYHALSKDEIFHLEACFEIINVYPVDDSIIQQAVNLRQQKKMSLGDAIIAATVLEYQQILATHNKKDFEWIEGIKIIDPIEELTM